MLEKIIVSPLFWLPLVMGLAYYIIGYMMIKNPPKYMSGMYGYRSKRSKLSQKHWDFAQKFSAILLKKFGVLCFPFCSLALVSDGKSETFLLLLVLAISFFPALIVIVQTEKFLKEFS
jgi:uncharacterized membrane protein